MSESNNMMLRLTRVTGTPISINAGIIASCEEMDGHTVIVTAGDDPEVYHVLEDTKSIERLINLFLRGMIKERLERMEADPKWERIFRESLESMIKFGMGITDREDFVAKIYQRIAAVYAKSQEDQASRIDAKTALEIYNKYRKEFYPSVYSKNYDRPLNYMDPLPPGPIRPADDMIYQGTPVYFDGNTYIPLKKSK